MNLMFAIVLRTIQLLRILCWWGIWVLFSPAISSDSGLDSSTPAALYASIVSPSFTTIYASSFHFPMMLLQSTLALEQCSTLCIWYCSRRESTSEKLGNDETRNLPTPGTEADTGTPLGNGRGTKFVIASTSILFPIPPALYRSLPKIVKSTVLLDFGMYRTCKTEEGEQEARLV